MPDSPLRRPSVRSVVEVPETLDFVVGADGRLLLWRALPAGLLPAPPEAVVGRPAVEVMREGGGDGSLVTRALAGETVAELVVRWGLPWCLVLTPRAVPGYPVAEVQGAAYRLPEGTVAEAPTPRERVWELAGEPAGEASYWSGDCFLRTDGEPGAILTRFVPDGELLRLLSEYPDRMHLISDSGPSSASRRLRLVP